MKKLLFVIHNMECGGVQTALINMLNAISGDYDVYLRCFSMPSRLPKGFSENIKVLNEIKKMIPLGERSSVLRKKSKKMFVKKAFYNLVSRFFGGKISHKLFFNRFKEEGEYDVAVSYVQDVNGRSFSVGCNDYVINCVKAKKKITFVHCDFSMYGGNDRINRSRYNDFDSIVCVSLGCKNRFISCVPAVAQKTFVLRNFYDVSVPAKASYDSFKYDSHFINLLSVSRISREKGIHRALTALSFSKRNDIRYYIIGSGPLEKDLQKFIHDHDMEKYVFLIGQQDNPYRYMANADYLFVPSYHEAAPIVFDEANLLGLPVLATKTLSADEMLNSNSIIVENDDKEILKIIIALKKPVIRSRIEIDNSSRLATFSRIINC